MANRSMTSRLIMDLVDRVSAPAKRVASALTGISRSVRETNGSRFTFSERLDAAMFRNNQALDATRGRLFDAAAAAYGLRAALAAPITAGATFETMLEDIGQKADIPQEKLGALGEQIQQVAKDTNMAASEVGAAIDAMVGRGASVDTALAAADPVARAAFAYRASADDMAAAAWSAVDNLKVPADQLETAVDAMAVAGKEGAFELRDMAQYFPMLGAAYQAFGQEGTGAVADLAAALQVVRKGTGDSASAATNLQNVLQKMMSPVTEGKFDKMGVNLREEMAKAVESGLTPLEAIAEITDKTLGGDLSKIGYLFEDMQAQAGVRMMIQNLEEFRRIRALAMGADGTLDRDYARRLETFAGVQKRWTAATEKLAVAVGMALLPALTRLLDVITPMIERFSEFAQAHPNIVSGAIAIASGLVAIRVASAALTFALLTTRGALLGLLAAGRTGLTVLMALSRGAMVAGAVLGRVLVGSLGLVATAIRGIIALLMANPIGIAIAAIATAAYLIYRNWDTIGPFFWRLWDSIKAIFVGFKDFVVGVFTGDMGAAAAGLMGAWDGLVGYFQTIWDGIVGVFSNAWAQIKPIIDGLKWVANRGGAAFKSVFGKGPSDTGAATEDFGVDGARAKGGPISRGGRYLVGENGPELITASRSGYVHPTGQGMGGGGITVNLGGITIHGAAGQSVEAIASAVQARIEDAVRRAIQGVQADVGMVTY